MGIYNLFSFIYPCIPQALLAVLPPINSLKFFLSNLYPANNAKFNNIHLKYTSWVYEVLIYNLYPQNLRCPGIEHINV